MRLSAGQLRQIIKEEVARVRASRNGRNRRRLRENAGAGSVVGKFDAFYEAQQALEARGVGDVQGEECNLSLAGEGDGGDAYIAILFNPDGDFNSPGGQSDGCVLFITNGQYFEWSGGQGGMWVPAQDELIDVAETA